MFNLFLKILLCPGVIFLADVISPAVNYSSGWHIISTGLFMAILGYMMDALLLMNIGSEVEAVIDTTAAVIVVYLSQVFSGETVVTFFGALLGGGLLGLSEYITHRLILGDGYREKRSTSQ